MNYCKVCMEEVSGYSDLCPNCSNKPKQEVPSHHLKPYTILKERYKIGYALGEGGFGITYIGRDLLLGQKVAIKEYYPNGFVNRNHTVSQELIAISGKTKEDIYKKGKQRFWDEAKALAKHASKEGVVNVLDYFSENNTIYIVMEYLDGQDLRNYLKEKGKLSEQEVIKIVKPIMVVLEQIHQEGFIHRDISPDNIRITSQGTKLMDFGAAREVTEDDKTLSVLLKHGYAPEEQYRSKGHQGPWTDVYALCATIYKCITGIRPIRSSDRVFDDELQKPSELDIKVTPEFEKVLMQGLSVYQKDRIQSMSDLLMAFEQITYQTEEVVDAKVTNHNAEEVKTEPYKENPTTPYDEESTMPCEENKNVDLQQADSIKENPSKINIKTKLSKTKNRTKGIIFVLICIVAVVSILFWKVTTSTSELSYLGKKITKDVVEEIVNDKSVDYLILKNCTIEKNVCDQLKKSNLSHIKELTIENSKVQNYGFISKMNDLVFLKIEDCNLTDNHLKSMDVSNKKQLETLVLSKNPDLSYLSIPDNSSLKKIDISSTSIKSNVLVRLAPNMKNLKILYAANNKYDELSFLTHFKNLSNLNLSNNNISNLKGIENCTRLKKVNLSNNKFKSIDKLKKMKNIEILYISNNKLTNINVVSGFENLYELHVENNNLKNIKSLENLSKLENVDLDYNKIKDIMSLESSKKTMKYLSIRGNSIKNIDVCDGMVNLQMLRIDYTAIISMPANLPNLRELTHREVRMDCDLSRYKNLNKIVDFNGRICHLTEYGWKKYGTYRNEKLLERELEGMQQAYWGLNE